jgi:hypothetical protein
MQHNETKAPVLKSRTSAFLCSKKYGAPGDKTAHNNYYLALIAPGALTDRSPLL